MNRNFNSGIRHECLPAVLLSVAAALSLTGCATTEPYTPVTTASGKPEAYFASAPEQTSSRLSSMCMDRQGTVMQSTPNQVVCEFKMGMAQSVLATMAMGNQYSTPPQTFVRFNVIPTDHGSRVQGSAWIETTMAFGQKRTMDMSGGRAGSQIQGMLLEIGGVATPPPS